MSLDSHVVYFEDLFQSSHRLQKKCQNIILPLQTSTRSIISFQDIDKL